MDTDQIRHDAFMDELDKIASDQGNEVPWGPITAGAGIAALAGGSALAFGLTRKSKGAKKALADTAKKIKDEFMPKPWSPEDIKSNKLKSAFFGSFVKHYHAHAGIQPDSSIAIKAVKAMKPQMKEVKKNMGSKFTSKVRALIDDHVRKAHSPTSIRQMEKNFRRGRP